jgi:hypothetical protein
MIITRLEGGLGNQMFQYAVARQLSKIHSSPLKLDLSWFKTQQLRQYRLKYFNICEDFVTDREVETIIGNYSITKWFLLKIARKLGLKESNLDLDTHRSISGIIFNNTYAGWWLARAKHKIGLHSSNLSLYQKGQYIREKYHHFDLNILDAPNHVYLDGFWQSPRYFSGIDESLRQEFAVKHPESDLFNQISEQITHTYSVSLHVRRGDMANDPQTNRLHGTCDLNYYKLAVEYLSIHVSQPHFFIFSDEPEWVKENLNLQFPSTLVSYHGSLTDYEEMHLMSLCQHHIIANSTFSWWGAWLNPKPDKIVIAPQKFFDAFAYDHDTKDLYPSSWIAL